mgnify:CR=1 FL=1
MTWPTVAGLLLLAFALRLIANALGYTGDGPWYARVTDGLGVGVFGVVTYRLFWNRP